MCSNVFVLYVKASQGCLVLGADTALFDVVLGGHCRLLEGHVGLLALVTLWNGLVYCLQLWSSLGTLPATLGFALSSREINRVTG